jgi:hypothetical protein
VYRNLTKVQSLPIGGSSQKCLILEAHHYFDKTIPLKHFLSIIPEDTGKETVQLRVICDSALEKMKLYSNIVERGGVSKLSTSRFTYRSQCTVGERFMEDILKTKNSYLMTKGHKCINVHANADPFIWRTALSLVGQFKDTYIITRDLRLCLWGEYLQLYGKHKGLKVAWIPENEVSASSPISFFIWDHETADKLSVSPEYAQWSLCCESEYSPVAIPSELHNKSVAEQKEILLSTAQSGLALYRYYCGLIGEVKAAIMVFLAKEEYRKAGIAIEEPEIMIEKAIKARAKEITSEEKPELVIKERAASHLVIDYVAPIVWPIYSKLPLCFLSLNVEHNLNVEKLKQFSSTIEKNFTDGTMNQAGISSDMISILDESQILIFTLMPKEVDRYVKESLGEPLVEELPIRGNDDSITTGQWEYMEPDHWKPKDGSLEAECYRKCFLGEEAFYGPYFCNLGASGGVTSLNYEGKKLVDSIVAADAGFTGKMGLIINDHIFHDYKKSPRVDGPYSGFHKKVLDEERNAKE